MVVNIYYSERNGSARAFAGEEIRAGVVEMMRADVGQGLRQTDRILIRDPNNA